MHETSRSWWAGRSRAVPLSGIAVGTAIAVLVVAFLGPDAAVAGSYEVVACDAAPGGVNNAWHAREDRGTVASTSCPTRGDDARGLVVRNRIEDGTAPRGATASMSLSAPRGAELTRLAFGWDGRRVGGDWSLGLTGASDSDWIAGCPARPNSRRDPCRLGGGTVRQLDGRRSVRFVAICRGRGGCRTDAARSSRDRARARLAVHGAEVRIGDSSEPNLSGAGGALLGGGWLSGRVEGEFHAADNVGVRSTELEVDGERRSLDPRECDYTRRVPCPRAISRSYRLDTNELRDGEHEIAVTALDTASNVRLLARTIQVDNHAPAKVRDVRLAGRDGTRSTNSFDLRWTAPQGQAAPIARAHYRLCRVGPAPECVTGVRAGGRDGIDDLSVPARGDWRLRVWLEDAAGNADRSRASEPVVLSFDDRLPTSLSGGIETDDGPVRRATVDYGAEVAVSGALEDRGGDRLGGVPVTVLSRTRGAERFRRVDTVHTDARGTFSYRPRSGPSRTLRFQYEGDERHRPDTAEVKLTVRAKSTIAVNREHVRNGERVRFEGRLIGRPLPADGKLVELQAHYRDRWRTFAVTRTGSGGHWAHRYRFEATVGRVTYPFRARIPRERSYPYALGHSAVVRVTVHGR